MKREKHNIIPDKMPYSRGARPPVDCILCAVAEDDPLVERLVVYRHQRFYVTLNLYPYNPGHVMIVPLRHVEDVRALNHEEQAEMQQLQHLTLNVLEQVYSPGGFNVGYNLGRCSGASIPHLHLQIVPRYTTEVGFFDIIGDSRVIVEDPHQTQQRLSEAFGNTAQAFFAHEDIAP